MEKLREKRQEQLQRYDMGAMLSDIIDRLDQVVETERQGIEQRLQNAARRDSNDRTPSRVPPASNRRPLSPASRGRQQASPGGQQPPAASQVEDAAPNDALRKLLSRWRTSTASDSMRPDDPGRGHPCPAGLRLHGPEARQQFQELLDMLQQQMSQQMFQGMQQAMSQMTPEDISDMRQMMQELNEMLEARQRGEDPGFQEFMHRWGHFLARSSIRWMTCWSACSSRWAPCAS